MSDKEITVKSNDLKDTLLAVLEAARKPVVTEKELREEKDRQEQRAQNVAIQKELIANREFRQNTCTHRHQENNMPRVAYIQNGPPYLLCLKCQDIIRPEERPQLFNELIQSQLPAVY